MVAKRMIIAGGTSGIGLELVKLYVAAGWNVGVFGRNEKRLAELSAMSHLIRVKRIDVNADDAVALFEAFVEECGGMDLYFHSSGIGWYNTEAEADKELNTAETNVKGFMKMVLAAYRYFCGRGGGHIAVISSIAGTKGLGAAPAYSATKRFQNTYIDALAQNSRMRRMHVSFTDIRPGFVATPLLSGKRFPMLMDAGRVAEIIFRALERKKRRVTIDFRYSVLVALWRCIPAWLWERLPVK